MDVRKAYLDFFESKAHKVIPSASLVPLNDASVLFNIAGMQPLMPYFLGEKHPYGARLVNSQKCFRTNDLDSIGDKTHHTFFEMLGNWSLGDYFKKESITYSFEFLTDVLKLDVNKLAVTCFEGNKEIPKDEVSAQIWKSLGISEDKIAFLGVEDNFWIAGETGPCGPDTEIFYFRSSDEVPLIFDPEDDRWVEIWNNVFMEYNKDASGNITELPNKNVDTGMGLERITAVMENVYDNYETSLFKSVIQKLEDISGMTYNDNKSSMRIIADHLRAAVMLIADESGVRPSNTDQGYILRRLIRRMVRHARKLNIDIVSGFEKEIIKIFVDIYKDQYNELSKNETIVYEVISQEIMKFSKSLEKGLREFEKVTANINKLDKDSAFKLYDTYGFPIELTLELAEEKNIEVDVEGFYIKFKAHQELSRAGSKEKFKGGLASDGQMETKYHTATHLLNAALKIVVDPTVCQKGSNITSDRLRFDFLCDHKLTPEEITETESLVNKWISAGAEVTHETVSKEAALKSGAECMFIDRYPEIVNVYTVKNISSELCGGPHVENISVLGKFKILKEESSSAGVRRIKAKLE